MTGPSPMSSLTAFMRSGLGRARRLCLHIAACCWSLDYAADSYPGIVDFDRAHLLFALLIVAPFAMISTLFVISRFSFGYVLGFYFYTVILGYLWLVEFSQLAYDHPKAAVSMFLSGVAFLVPALFITSPIRQRIVLSARAFEIMLFYILVLGAIIVAVSASYNFKLASLSDIYKFREGLEFPAWLRYAIGMISNALLPFAYAGFVARGNRWGATTALLLILLFYPLR